MNDKGTRGVDAATALALDERQGAEGRPVHGRQQLQPVVLQPQRVQLRDAALFRLRHGVGLVDELRHVVLHLIGAAFERPALRALLSLPPRSKRRGLR